jgi:titin
VQGNFIGTDISGTNAIGNNYGGVNLVGEATGNVIGGLQPGAGNVVSGNPWNGVNLDGANDNVIAGNFIGTDPSGEQPVPNLYGGVTMGISNPTYNNQVIGNVVAYNGGGVGVSGGNNNTISQNRIFLNEGLGIDLGDWTPPYGVTPNDPGDGDTGANNLQNYPVLTLALAKPGRVVVRGYIDTPDPETITVEFFSTEPGGDQSGHGEGQVFLGDDTLNRKGAFTAVLPPVVLGTLITATATDAEGNTSEFSANIEVSRKGR